MLFCYDLTLFFERFEWWNHDFPIFSLAPRGISVVERA